MQSHQGITSPEAPACSGRSLLHESIESIKDWTRAETDLFVASYSTNKQPTQIAADLGISVQEFEVRKRLLIRRLISVSGSHLPLES